MYLSIKDTKNGYVILCLYIYDLLIVDSNNRVIKSTKDMLNSIFDTKTVELVVVILNKDLENIRWACLTSVPLY